MCDFRNPREYFAFLDNAEVKLEDGTFASFQLEFCRSVDSYVQLKHNQNQLCWSLKKVGSTLLCLVVGSTTNEVGGSYNSNACPGGVERGPKP